MTISIEVHDNKWTKGTDEDGNVLSTHQPTISELVRIWLRRRNFETLENLLLQSWRRSYCVVLLLNSDAHPVPAGLRRDAQQIPGGKGLQSFALWDPGHEV